MKTSKIADFDLPEGWASARLGELCEHPQYGWTTSAKRRQSGLRLLRTTDISGGEPDWTTVPFCDEEPDEPAKYRLRRGDIVISRAGSVGISHLLAECPPAIFASYLIRLRPLAPIPPEFVRLFLRSPDYWAAIADNTAGIAVQNINASKLKELDIPLPPLAEQRRIVAKVEELLARVNAARERLAKVRPILKRFRQSVLAAACSGQLTADWRAGRGDTSEAADDALPASWESVTVGDVIDNLKYGTSRKCDYSKKGVPVLRIPNVGNGVIDREDLKYAQLDKRELEQLRLRAGDVLMIRSNGSVSLLGKTALVGQEDVGSAYAGYLIRLRPNRSKALPEYLNAVLGSFDVRLRIQLPARSTSGVNNINSEEVRALPINLPPLDEQEEIMRRVMSLYAVAEKIETRAQAATARVGKITQAILARAFRGELVPTEAELARQDGRDYEPASALLERMRASRNGEHENSAARRAGRRTVAPARETLFDDPPAPVPKPRQPRKAARRARQR